MNPHLYCHRLLFPNLLISQTYACQTLCKQQVCILASVSDSLIAHNIYFDFKMENKYRTGHIFIMYVLLYYSQRIRPNFWIKPGRTICGGTSATCDFDFPLLTIVLTSSETSKINLGAFWSENYISVHVNLLQGEFDMQSKSATTESFFRSQSIKVSSLGI